MLYPTLGPAHEADAALYSSSDLQNSEGRSFDEDYNFFFSEKGELTQSRRLLVENALMLKTCSDIVLIIPEVTVLHETDAIRARAARARGGSRWVAHAEAEEERPSDGVHVALWHLLMFLLLLISDFSLRIGLNCV